MAPATKRMKHLRKLSQKAIINQEQDNMEEMEQFIILEDSEESDDDSMNEELTEIEQRIKCVEDLK